MDYHEFERLALALLRQRFTGPDDHPGLSVRRAELRKLFNSVDPDLAVALIGLLSVRIETHALSREFHSRLATATRTEMMSILQRIAHGGAKEGGQTFGEMIEKDAVRPGSPVGDSDYVNNAARCINTPFWRGPFILWRECVQGRGVGKIASLPRSEVHLDNDPLSGSSSELQWVYKSRAAAEAAMATPVASRLPDVLYTYYVGPGGLVYPTTVSDTTAPELCDAMRRLVQEENAAIRATQDLAISLLFWYVGARLPVKTSSGGRTRPPSTAGTTAGGIVGPLGRLSGAEIEQAIAASGGRTVELYTKLTQAPEAGRALFLTNSRAVAEAARTQGQIYVLRVPDVLFHRLKFTGVIAEGTVSMGNAVGKEFKVLPNAAELVARFLVK